MGNKAVSSLQIHPHLASLLAGVKWDQNFIVDRICPSVDTYGAEDYEYEVYDNLGLEDVPDEKSQRDMDGVTPELSLSTSTTRKGTLVERAFSLHYDFRRVNAARQGDRIYPVPSGMMSREERLRYRMTKRSGLALKIIKEKKGAGIFFNTNSYHADFRHAGLVDFAAVDLRDVVYKEKRELARRYGVAPDVAVCGDLCFARLQRNAVILDSISGGSTKADPAMVTRELVAATLGVQTLEVGEAVTQTVRKDGEPGVPTDLWNRNYFSLTYQGIDGFDEFGNPQYEDVDESSPCFAKKFYMNDPRSNVEYDIRTWESENGKLEWQEGTEFWNLEKVMQCGGIWTNTGT